ncbi:MAG: hypothetical protein JW828_00255 [Sedimentisphaerales bacterium]|nr:hypothetical protein [Sedimentisphaerales bacterium]
MKWLWTGAVLLCAGFLSSVGLLRAAPDLVITDVWPDNGIIRYQIQNIGDIYSPSGHDTVLTIDGLYAMTDWNLPTLKPGERADRYFDKFTWQCDQSVDDIVVTADADHDVKEDDENNNVRVERWNCDQEPPVILEGPTVSDIQTDSVKITWQTDELARGVVRYGRLAGVYENTVTETKAEKDHEIHLSGLSAGTTYHFITISVDTGSNQTTTNSMWFTTDVKSDGQPPSLKKAKQASTEAPFRFSAEAYDSSGVDYMRFYMDGRLIETDYAAPFECRLYPHELGLSPAEFFATHEIMAEAHDSGGLSISMGNQVAFMDRCFPAEFECEFPYDGYRILIPGATVPAEESPLWVRVFGSATPWREVVRFGEVFEMGDPLDKIELYINDVLMHTEYNTNEMIHPTPITGWPRGEYRVKATAYTSDCIPVSIIRRVIIANPTPELRLSSRTVTRNGTRFTIELEFYNAGSADAEVRRVIDNLTGFQVVPSADGSYGRTYNITSRKTTVQWDWPDGEIIPPGRELMISYEAIPVLYQGFDSYCAGEDAVRFDWGDTSGHGNETRTVMPYSGRTFRDEVYEAFRESDYLMITSCANLRKHDNAGRVRALLRKMTELAKARNAVFGFFESNVLMSTPFDKDDMIATGSLFGSPDSGEIYIADEENDCIHCYDATEEIKLNDGDDCLIEHEGLAVNDRLAVANFIGSGGGVSHPPHEILVISGSPTAPGEESILYKYKPDYNRFDHWHIDTDFEAGDPIAAGNVYYNATFTEDELMIAKSDGRIQIYSDSLSEMEEFSSVYVPGDLLAAGNVIDDFYAEIIVGDVSSNRLYFYDHEGNVLRFYTLPHGRDLATNDQIVVGDVSYDDRCEILVVDDSEDRVYRYRYHEEMGAFMTGGDFAMAYHPDDAVLLGNPMGLEKSQFIYACGERRSGRIQGDLEIGPFSESSVSPGDRHTLDSLLECDGAWATKLCPGWCDGGYLLFVGETRIIPAFSAKYGDVGKGDKIIEYTDNFYANTAGHEKQPELCVGRIIGNKVDDMIVPIETTLGILNGTRDFNQSHALIVSGEPRGPSGDATTINFNNERNRIERRIDDNWSHTTELDEPGESTWVSNMVGKDVIHLAAHGWENGIDRLHDTTVRDSWDPGAGAPLVYANSCLTGRYPPTKCLGERFLFKGASAYIGATEVSYSPYNRYLAEGFWERFDVGYTAGRALKEAKRNRMGDDSYGKYNSAIYHLYGDPKLEPVLAAPSEMQTAVPPPAEDLQGPLSSIHVTIPMYDVLHSEGDSLEDVSIPGGTMLMIPDKPLVPAYDVSIRFPAGYRVQNVELLKKEGLHEDTLSLPVVTPAETGPSAPPPASAAVEGWWPEEEFEWSTIQEPGKETTLVIHVYPFRTNPNTTHVQFYQSFDFAIDYIQTDVTIRKLQTTQTMYRLGESVRWDLLLQNSGKKAVDLLVETAIHTPDDGVLTGLPIRRLHNVEGLATLEQSWDSTGCDPNSLTLEVVVRSLSGAVLDQDAAVFSLGQTDIDMGGLNVTPRCFSVQESVTIKCKFQNMGDQPVSGTLAVEILDMEETVLESFEEEFEDLDPDQTLIPSFGWKATQPRGACQIKAYVLYDGKMSEVASWPSPSLQADGDLNDDGRIGLEDFAIVARCWLTDDAAADIAPDGGDCLVDWQDLSVLLRNWTAVLE